MTIRKVGIVGCGYIGGFVARKIQDWPNIKLVAVADQDESLAVGLAGSLKYRPEVTSPAQLVGRVDMVVEAASKSAVAALLPEVLSQGKDLLVMSVGGLLTVSPVLWDKILAHVGRIYVPSGALAGLDALRAARFANLTKVSLTTRKPPVGLKSAPYVVEQKISLDNLSQPQVIFEGTARQAVAGFPQNINVAAAVSLAGLGPDKTQVRIMADPQINVNIHQLEFSGDFGRVSLSCENLPSPENPKTSYLAALAALAVLERYLSPLQLGS